MAEGSLSMSSFQEALCAKETQLYKSLLRANTADQTSVFLRKCMQEGKISKKRDEGETLKESASPHMNHVNA